MSEGTLIVIGITALVALLVGAFLLWKALRERDAAIEELRERQADLAEMHRKELIRARGRIEAINLDSEAALREISEVREEAEAQVDEMRSRLPSSSSFEDFKFPGEP